MVFQRRGAAKDAPPGGDRLKPVRRRGAVAALLAGVLLFALPAAPAQAHAVLLATEPVAGAVLEEAPEAVTLRFNEPVSVALGGVRILDQEGERVEAGQARRSGDGTTISVPLPALSQGAYVVAWRVVSTDSHPVRGTFLFRVGAGGTADDDRDLLARLLATEEGSPFVGGVFAVVRFAAFAALALLVGGAAFVVVMWPAGASSRRFRLLMAGAWTVALASTAAGVVLQGPYVLGLPLTEGLRPAVLSDVLSTRFGQVWTARVVLLLAALPLLRALGRGERLPRWWAPAGVALGGGLLLTPGLAGHAATGELVALALAADAVHLGAVAVWLGGLAVLAAAVLPRGEPDVVRAVVPRFSTVAFAAVVTIVATGAFQSWRQVRSIEALTTTTYGRLLLAKLVAFAVLLGVAALSRQVVRARLRLSRMVPVPAGPGAMHAEADAAMRLRRSVGAEVGIAAAVLALTALLVNAVPAREALARPFSTTVSTAEVVVDLTIDPARAGGNAVHLYTFGPEGTITDPAELTASLSEPQREVGPLPVDLEKMAPGHWMASGVDIPFPGTWRFDLVVRLSEFERVQAHATFAVR